MRPAGLAVILDCCCVLVFVIIGRASHTRARGGPQARTGARSARPASYPSLMLA